MAKIDRLPFNLSGKIGDYVYYKWKGKNVVRKRPAPKKNGPSLLEQQARSRFSFMMKFLSPLNSLFNETFKSNEMSALNRALSVNLNHVIPGSYPDWRVDFSKLLLGEGGIPGVINLSVDTPLAGHLLFNWEGQFHPRYSTRLDRVYTAVHCEDLNLWLTHVGSVYRKDDSFVLDVELFSGFPVHVYLGLISDLWGDSSDSQYLGRVQVSI